MKLVRAQLAVAVLVFLVPATSLLAKSPPPPDVKADTRDTFAPVADHVREQMQAGGRFEFVNAEERGTVTKDLGDMQSLLDRFTKVDAMDDKSKIQLYNDQSEINAILTRRDGDKEICVHEQPTGSHLPKTTCRKYSDMERDRAATMQMKDEMLHTTIPKPLLIGPNAH
ncbi:MULTISPECIES: hypothetical protein [unclassified Dyella]|jgi:hypothetical protein|uniref:hypothetical protein n=1 Tax=unclassified Dyella TaxID=2634549 RepID=UPI003F9003C3